MWVYFSSVCERQKVFNGVYERWVIILYNYGLHSPSEESFFHCLFSMCSKHPRHCPCVCMRLCVCVCVFSSIRCYPGNPDYTHSCCRPRLLSHTHRHSHTYRHTYTQTRKHGHTHVQPCTHQHTNVQTRTHEHTHRHAHMNTHTDTHT